MIAKFTVPPVYVEIDATQKVLSPSCCSHIVLFDPPIELVTALHEATKDAEIWIFIFFTRPMTMVETERFRQSIPQSFWIIEPYRLQGFAAEFHQDVSRRIVEQVLQYPPSRFEHIQHILFTTTIKA